MESIRIEIKDITNLDSLSREYDLSKEELIAFHNQHCALHEIIPGNLPKYLKYIYIPADKESKRKEKSLLASQIALPDTSQEGSMVSEIDYLTKSSPKAIPLEIDGEFETSAGRKFTIRIYPGNVNGQEPQKQTYEIQRGREQELVKLFKDFYAKIGKKDFEIHLKLSPDFKTGKVYLKKGNLEQEIPKVQVDIFDMTFDQ